MRRNPLTLAVAAALLAPAGGLAQSSVTVYGTLNADIESVSATGAAVPGGSFASRNRVSSNSSNVGFRGTEDLGGGLKAFFQVESAANIDAGGGFWASRNSGVALIGNWGQILLGQWDTPYKVSTAGLDPFGNTTIGAYSGIMGLSGSLTSGQGGANFQQQATFDRRASNVVQYWTPTVAGFHGRVAYGASDSNTPPPGPTEDLKPTLWSAMAAYSAGPFYATVAWEQHEDFQPLNTLFAAPLTNGRDDAWKLGASYKYRGFTFSGAYEWLRYRADSLNSAALAPLIGPGIQNVIYKVNNWLLGATYETGAHVVGVNYVRKDDDELNGADVADTKAYQLGLRYGYNFSKRTQVYAMAVWFTNDANAFQTFGVNALGATAPLGQSPQRGADPAGYGIGMRHTF